EGSSLNLNRFTKAARPVTWQLVQFQANRFKFKDDPSGNGPRGVQFTASGVNSGKLSQVWGPVANTPSDKYQATLQKDAPAVGQNPGDLQISFTVRVVDSQREDAKCD